MKDFFNTFYVPGNATLAVGGSFDLAKTKDLIEEYFGSIPCGKPVPEIASSAQSLETNKTIMYEDEVQLPRIYLAWHTVRAFDSADAALDLLASILSDSKNL